MKSKTAHRNDLMWAIDIVLLIDLMKMMKMMKMRTLVCSGWIV